MGYYSNAYEIEFEADFSYSTLTMDELMPYINCEDECENLNMLSYLFDIRADDRGNGFVNYMSITANEESKSYNLDDDFQEFRSLLHNRGVVFNLKTLIVGEEFLDAVKYVVNNDGVFTTKGVLTFPDELKKVR